MRALHACLRLSFMRRASCLQNNVSYVTSRLTAAKLIQLLAFYRLHRSSFASQAAKSVSRAGRPAGPGDGPGFGLAVP